MYVKYKFIHKRFIILTDTLNSKEMKIDYID